MRGVVASHGIATRRGANLAGSRHARATDYFAHLPSPHRTRQARCFVVSLRSREAAPQGTFPGADGRSRRRLLGARGVTSAARLGRIPGGRTLTTDPGRGLEPRPTEPHPRYETVSQMVLNMRPVYAQRFSNRNRRLIRCACGQYPRPRRYALSRQFFLTDHPFEGGRIVAPAQKERLTRK